MSTQPIRVFLIDQPHWIQTLKSLLHDKPEVTIVGTATDSQQALTQLASTQTDVICTGLTSSTLDGIHLIHTIMAEAPKPFVVFMDTSEEHLRPQLQELEQTGAIQVITRIENSSPHGNSFNSSQLLHMLKVLAGVLVLKRPHHIHRSAQLHAEAAQTNSPVQIVTIGASTGGPQAFHTLFELLPQDLSVPLLCVQHISPGFTSELVQWLQEDSLIHVRIAEPGIVPQRGIAYFPEEQTHLTVDTSGALYSSRRPPKQGHRPSIDETFQSVAQLYGSSAIGVLLTGMGNDGTTGMQAIADAGGTTIVQEAQSCVVASMPQSVIEAKAASHVLPLEQIVPTVLQLLGHPQRVSR